MTWSQPAVRATAQFVVPSWPLMAVALGAVALVLAGCPDTTIGDTPPFDTTGNYSGMYSTNNKQFGGAADCNMELELVQFVNTPLIAYTFAGIARLNWDCILPQIVRTSLGIESDVLVAPVLATLNNNGGFALDVDLDGSNIPQALLDQLDASEVDPNIPLQSFTVHFAGTGVDTDNDGLMDSCMGTLSVMATYEDNGTQTIDLDGTFDVTRAAAT